MAKKKQGTKTEETSAADNVIDVEVEEVEAEDSSATPKGEKRSLLLYFLTFLLVVGIFGFLGYKFLLGTNSHLDDLEDQVQEAEIVVLQQPDAELPKVDEQIKQADLQYGQAVDDEENTVLEDVVNLIDGAGDITSDVAIDSVSDVVASTSENAEGEAESRQAPIIIPPVAIAPAVPEVKSEEIEALKKQNQNILLYLSAQNLQEIIDGEIDVKKLSDELAFFKKIAGDEGRYAGKIQIIEYSLEGKVESAAALSKDLDKLANALANIEEKDFVDNLQDSIFGLVKVTKLDESADGDYPKILLAKKALGNGDVDKAIQLIEKIDVPVAKTWVERAFKLQRMQRSVNYLLDNSRKNLVQ